MKNVIKCFISLGLMVAGMASVLLIFHSLSYLFTGSWELAQDGKAVAGFLGFIFGIILNFAYYD